MSRFFAPITLDDFKKKVEKAFPDLEDGLRDLKDLKVDFDFENFYSDIKDAPNGLMGYRTLPNGMAILGLSAGGDWESPVYFILYWDGKKIRGYVPTDGNPWNTTTKAAYGSDSVADLKNAKKRWPEIYKNSTEVDACDFEFDAEAITKDIITRILPVKISAPLLNAITQLANHSTTKPPRPSLQERIEALTYYGTGDEGYELFQTTCLLCYKMVGLGYQEQAKIVCGFAEDQAESSQEWWTEDGNSLDDKSDSAQGTWGN